MQSNYSIDKAKKEELELKNILNEFVSTSTKEFRLLIIEGPAGSGKTEAVRYLKSINNSKKIAYSAPTRQAASNLRLRKINYARTTQKYISDFKFKIKNASDYNIFVIDEASLLTKKLILDLFESTKLNLNLKFLFLGDSGQNFPWDPKTGTEKIFYGLELKELMEIYRSFWKNYDKRNIIDHEFRKIHLNTNWRLLNKSVSVSQKYFELLINLRNGVFDGEFDDLLSIDEINEFREQDIISHLINTNHEGLPNTLFKIINRDKLTFDEKIQRCVEEIQDSTFWKNNNKEYFANNFTPEEIKNTVTKRFELKHSRPQMGEIYNQFFSAKKNNSANVISLFRSNKNVHQANLDIRQHLNHVKNMERKIDNIIEKEMINSKLKEVIPVQGDFMFVAGDDEDFNEHLNSKRNTQETIYPGDLVMASSNIRRSQKSKELLNSIFGNENYFFEMEIEPLIYLPESFSQKAAQFIFKQKRSVLVWIGGMLIENRKEAYDLFKKQCKDLSEFIEVEESTQKNDDDKLLELTLKELGLTFDDYKILTGGFSEKTPKTGAPLFSTESNSERRFARPKSINGQTSESIKRKMNQIKSKNSSDKYDLLKEIKSISENSILIYYAYALTHKTAQGGEWKNIIIESADIWEKDQNRFLYTALTRSLNNIYFSYIK